LMYGGAVLQLYPVHEMRIGRPRALFSAVGAPLDWRGVVWEAGVLDPAHPAVRTVRPEGDEDAASSPVVPPTAEEAIPVPDRFRIRFEGGLALEVRSSAEADDAGWWARQRAAWALRWDDVFSALWPSDRDAVRLLVTLDRDAAGALYRALPPETRLLVSAEVPAAASK
jgi:hypothetical protein